MGLINDTGLIFFEELSDFCILVYLEKRMKWFIKHIALVATVALSLLLLSCKSSTGETQVAKHDSAISCESNLPSRYGTVTNDTSNVKRGEGSTEGMIFIAGGEFIMGATDEEGRTDEYPSENVARKHFGGGSPDADGAGKN